MTAEIIPFEHGLIRAILIAVICTAILWGLRPVLFWCLKQLGLTSDKLYMKLLILIAVMLSPFWLLFTFHTLRNSLGVMLNTDPAAQNQHIAFAILILTLGILTAAPFLLAMTVINERRTRIAEIALTLKKQAQITDRFAKAVTQLGAIKTLYKRNAQVETAPNLEIRLGALFTLERISQISPGEHIAVMETLCAYIRENATSHQETMATNDMPTQFAAPRTDIQIAIKILGRRGAERIAREAALDPPYRIDLRGADLAVVDFSGGNFGPAMMARSNLQSAWLDNTAFRGADFSAANMTRAWLEDADLEGAHMQETTLNGAWMIGANLRHCVMDGAELRGAKIRGADLQGAELDGIIIKDTDIKGANTTLTWLRAVDCTGFDNLSQEQLDRAFGDFTTDIPKGFTRPLWPRQQISYLESFQMWNDAKKLKKVA